ncbi:hypothetical protein MMC29_004206 [Sticta canariensis]|nr:hypothetical protein [Sticta canariensis]
MDGQTPLYAKNPGDYYYRNLRFSSLALEIICCSALFTNLKPHEVARVLRGATDQIHDLSNVQASDIRGCFFQMLDSDYPIYRYWSHTHPNDTQDAVDPLLRYFDDTQITLWFESDWDSERQIARPMWGR